MENSHKKIKLKVLAVFGALILIVIALTIARGYIFGNSVAVEQVEQRNQESGQTQNSVTITRQSGDQPKLNFQQINFDTSSILDDPIIQDLPKSASIELKIGETSYTLSKDSVNLGKPSNPDLTIAIPADYASKLSSGVCETIKTVSNDGHLGIEIHSSEASLLWKYKGMMKYKSCLG